MSKQKTQTPQPTNKQVANSNIGYQGVVTITTYKGKQRKSSFSQKNAGQQPLFNFLVSCLNGQFRENNRPNFIRLRGGAEEEPEVLPADGGGVLTGLIKATKIITGPNSETQANITYSFIVPYFMLNTPDATTMYVYRAQLLNNANEVCAWADIEVQDGFDRPFLDKSKPDYSLVIDWKLSIANNESNIPVEEVEE